MASRRLSSKISANQREEKTSWNVNKHWKNKGKHAPIARLIFNVISAKHHFTRLFQYRNSTSRDVFASSPSFSRLAARAPLFQNCLQRNIWNRLLTYQIIWANVCLFFFFFLVGQIRIWIQSLAFTWFWNFRNSAWTICIMSFILGINSFLKPKILLALKVLQVFPGKIIAWKYFYV